MVREAQTFLNVVKATAAKVVKVEHKPHEEAQDEVDQGDDSSEEDSA